MTKIVITGFGPFPGVDVNPTQKLMAELENNLSNENVTIEVLPTEWNRAADAISRLHDQENPDVLLHFGVHDRDDFIYLERTAKNYVRQAQDACGQQCSDQQVEVGGSAELKTEVPLEKLIDDLNAKAIPTKISDDAGDYLCNYSFYKSLSLCGGADKARTALFIHVPDPHKNAKASFEKIVTAAENIVEVCAR